jgi:hypothetical protein
MVGGPPVTRLQLEITSTKSYRFQEERPSVLPMDAVDSPTSLQRETRHGRLSGIFSIRRAYYRTTHRWRRGRISSSDVRLMGVQMLSLTLGSLNWRDIILRVLSLAGSPKSGNDRPSSLILIHGLWLQNTTRCAIQECRTSPYTIPSLRQPSPRAWFSSCEIYRVTTGLVGPRPPASVSS